MLNWFKKLFKSNPVEKRLIDDYYFNQLKKENQEELDRILDKISDKGMKSLTKEELKFLKKNTEG